MHRGTRPNVLSVTILLAMTAVLSSPASGAELPYDVIVIRSPEPQIGAAFGHTVSPTGDLNGDRVSDFIVGARYQNVDGNENQGKAYVFSGANGAPLFALDNPTPQAGASFGRAVTGVGDVDGDAVSDLLVAAPFQNVGGRFQQGQAFVFSGGTGELIHTLDDPGFQEVAHFGLVVDRAGDVNGDSVPDLYVGAHFQDVGDNTRQGKGYVYSGVDGSLLLSLDTPTPQAGAAFGAPAAGLGDVNGDSVPDFVAGAFGHDVDGLRDQGRAFVVSGATGEGLHVLDNPNPQVDGYFGAVGGVGDVNGDDVADVIVGALGQTVGGNEAQGQAFVFNGRDGNLLFTLDNPYPQVYAQFGRWVSGVKDVDGDAVPDIVVGALGQDVGSQVNQGQVFLFSGGTGEFLRSLDNPYQQTGSAFGKAVAGMGDLNGDGRGDILVGAPLQGQLQAGAAFLFVSSASDSPGTVVEPPGGVTTMLSSGNMAPAAPADVRQEAGLVSGAHATTDHQCLEDALDEKYKAPRAKP